jgi:hypothetical protein
MKTSEVKVLQNPTFDNSVIHFPDIWEVPVSNLRMSTSYPD